jgi:hypothetical protein
MVESSGQAFLRLSDDRVLGHSAPAQGSTGGSKSGANSSVPNSLLAGIPLVKVPTSGHGTANPTNSTTNAAQSKSGGAISKSPTSDSGSTGSSDSGNLPSPVTH